MAFSKEMCSAIMYVYILEPVLWKQLSQSQHVTFYFLCIFIVGKRNVFCFVLFSEQPSRKSVNAAQDLCCGVAASETQQDDSLLVWFYCNMHHPIQDDFDWKEKRFIYFTDLLMYLGFLMLSDLQGLKKVSVDLMDFKLS